MLYHLFQYLESLNFPGAGIFQYITFRSACAIILSLIMPTVQIVPIGIMIVSWVFFFISVRIDSKQLRPLRQEAYERAERKAAKQSKKH